MTQASLIAERAKVIEFSIAGLPVPQGSKQSLISGKRVKRNGAVWVRNPIASIVDSSNRATSTRKKGALDRWRNRISDKARALMGEQPLWDQAIELSCEFIIPRKPSHYTKRGALTKSAPRFPTLPDISKLVRAVEDAMTKVVYRDDGLIVQYGEMRKRYAHSLFDSNGQPLVGGVHVKVRCL